jgi:hypothetical protein
MLETLAKLSQARPDKRVWLCFQDEAQIWLETNLSPSLGPYRPASYCAESCQIRVELCLCFGTSRDGHHTRLDLAGR